MIYMLFWSLLFILSTSAFSFSYSYGGIDRTFKGLNKGAAESAVDPFHPSASGAPRFKVELFLVNAEKYLAYNLSPYVKEGDYATSYSYYLEDGAEITAKPAYCSGLGVSIEASVAGFSTYRNHVSFWIRKGSTYE